MVDAQDPNRRSTNKMDMNHTRRLDEEIATEFNVEEDTSRHQVEVSHAYGWVALVLSILSFFMFPIFLGAAGIVVGFMARNRHSEWLGNIAIAAGIISIILSFFLIPYV